jgi:hypothetical protein
VHDGALYWTETGRVFEATEGSSEAREVVSDLTELTEIVVDARDIFTLESTLGRVVRISRDGDVVALPPGRTPKTPTSDENLTALGIDGDYVYWGTQGGQVFRLARE